MLNHAGDIIKEAKSLSKEQRKEILMSLPETELHIDLKSLFERMEPDYLIEITHGVGELGKDLVIVRQDKFTIDVVAVIVKMGNIRGKTLGDVDNIKRSVESMLSYRSQKALEEILSQIEQASVHHACLKTLFEELPITRIIVVLCGDISGNARDRITREVKHKVEIFDVNWLIEKFTEYYPQVFFQGRVIDFVQEKIRGLENTHLFSKCGKTFSECFVDPLVATFDLPVNIADETFALTVKKHKIQFSKLKEILEHKRSLLLVGDPGTGKTGALTKITIDMYRATYKDLTGRGSNHPKVSIPIFVRAADLLNIDNVDALLLAHFPSPEVRDRFVVNALLVDALDEVQSSNHSLILERGHNFAKVLDCSLVITSRKIEAMKNPPKKYERFELLPFEIGQALRLIRKLIDNKSKISALREGLQRISYAIPMNPLSLMLLVQLVEEHQEVPASVTELYDRFADIVLGRMDKEKGIEVLFEYLIKKRFLSTLAYQEFLEKDRIEIPKADFDSFVNAYAKEYGWDEEALRKFTTEMDRAGLLVKNNFNLSFGHRSFLDYFVAFYLFDKRGELQGVNEKIVRLYFNSLWDDVTFYYIGLGREITKTILDGIYAYKPEKNEGAYEKLLVGRLIQAGWHTPQLIKEEGIRKSLSYLRPIENHVLELSEKVKIPIPKLIVDFLLMVLSELSFGSTFLLNEVQNIITKLIESEEVSRDDLLYAIALFWSIQRLLPPKKREQLVTDYLDAIKKAGLNAEDQGRLYLLLKIIEKNDPSLTRTVRRKLDKQFNALIRSAKSVIRGLLPDKKKKWRIEIRG